MLLCHFVVVCTLVLLLLSLGSSSSSTTTTSNGLEEKYSLFKSWFVENGGIFQGIDIHNFEGMGNGLITTSKVDAEQMILRIPQSMIFSITNLQAHVDFSRKQILKYFQDEMALNVWLLMEREDGEESFFAPYIDILPTYVSSALYFTVHQLESLQTPSFAEEVRQFQDETYQEYEKFRKIVNENRAVFPRLQKISYGDYLWAATIFHSRGLRFRGQANLAPMADLFNYQAHPESRLAKSGEFFLKHHVLGEADITIYADRNQAEPKTQLFEDYGDNPNEIYLKYHGFVPDYNPFHCVRLSGEHVGNKVMDSLSATHKQLLSTLRFTPNLRTCVDQTGDLTKQFEVFLTSISLSEEEAKSCLTYFQPNQRNQDWATIYRKCGFERTSRRMHDLLQANHNAKQLINEKNLEDRTWILAKELLKNTIRKLNYPTNIDQDEKAIKQLEKSLKTRKSEEEYKSTIHSLLATKYRLNNKKLYSALCESFGIQQDCYDYLYGVKNTEEEEEEEEPVAAAVEPIKLKDESKVAVSKFSREVKEIAEITEPRVFEQTVAVVDEFNAWFDEHNPENSKIRAAAMRNFRIGTVATKEIKEEEVYLSIPDTIIMSGEKGFQESEVKELLQSLSTIYKSRDDFHELLLFLVHEAFIKGSDSFFWPYINSLPRFTELDNPIFWPDEILEERLSPSFIKSGVTSYQHSVSKKYGFISKVPEIGNFFKKFNYTLSEVHYVWASTILDSRSIWWNGKRHLVPMLDFVNCKVNSANPDRVHSTALDESGVYAITKSGNLMHGFYFILFIALFLIALLEYFLIDGNYKVGEQLFENYGQPNHIYFLYHGFSLPADMNQQYDCVQYEFSLTITERKRLEKEGYQKLVENLRVMPNNLFSTCLQLPISSHTWAFLSLKTTSYKTLIANKQLGMPTRAAVKYLQESIAQRLELYENIDTIQ